MDERLSASLEDYIEAISRISTEKHVARARDIARRLEVNQSSVTVALRALAKRGLINYAPYDFVTLTPLGEKISEDVLQRHHTLRRFFKMVLLIENPLADKAACEMEHSLPHEILVLLSEFVDFVQRWPQCLERFHHEQAQKRERDRRSRPMIEQTP